MKIKPNQKLNNLANRYSRVAILLLVISILVVGFSAYWYLELGNHYKPDVTKDFKLYYQTDMNGEFRYLDVQSLTKSFTVNDKVYYLAMDKKGIYILKMDDSTFGKLENIQKYTYAEISEEPKAEKVTGKTHEVDENLKQEVIKQYNTIFNTKYLSDENFNSVVGNVYLDTTEQPTAPYLNYALGFSVVFGVCGLFFLMYSIINSINNNAVLAQLDKSSELAKINEELNTGNILDLRKYGIILTPSYIIDNSKKLMVMKYSNIKWMYPVLDKFLGKAKNKSVMVVSVDSNRRKMLTIPARDKKAIEDLYRYIGTNSPNIITKNESGLHGDLKQMQEEQALNNAFGKVDNDNNKVTIQMDSNAEKVENKENAEVKKEPEVSEVKRTDLRRAR